MKVAVFNNPETGRLAVVYPAYNDAARANNQTDDDFLAYAMSRCIPDGTTGHIVDSGDLPTDRTFRDAWEWVD